MIEESASLSTTFAPGARLIIRDEEWLVESALPVTTGGTAVRVLGLSELVGNRETDRKIPVKKFCQKL